MSERASALPCSAEAIEQRASDPSGGPSDADLLRQLGNDDQEAMKLLYRRHAPSAYSLAKRICQDGRTAEDVVQEVFLTVWREPSRYDPERGRFTAWLLTLVHHKSVDILRRHRALQRRRTVPDNGDGEVGPESPGPGPDDAAIGMVAAGDVRDALGRLPAEQRRTLILCYVGGYTYREIAMLTGVPLGTVKSRLSSGVRKLRSLLGRWSPT